MTSEIDQLIAWMHNMKSDISKTQEIMKIRGHSEEDILKGDIEFSVLTMALRAAHSIKNRLRLERFYTVPFVLQNECVGGQPLMSRRRGQCLTIKLPEGSPRQAIFDALFDKSFDRVDPELPE